jgi:glycosidase
MSFPHVGWSRQASIYEVNIRQFTPEGTFSAFEAQLPRLQALGVGILWLMPIQPIGIKNRKGTLGSYYSIRDYTAVNPDFGTLADFRHLVDAAHALGMKLILDWVANHTAWDHRWVGKHPEWFQRNAQGEIHPYTYRPTPHAEPEYWWDVIGLDYGRPTLWPAMTDAMLFWLREADIDGFRCDVASLVPTSFWEQARVALERVKPVFMLAESDAPELHRSAFDMTYDWQLFGTLKRMAKGQAGKPEIQAWWQRRQTLYPADAYGMNFTANHDSNSWHGSDASFFGPAFEALAVLAAILPGMPLVYGGQEAVLDKQLAFFEKDAIDWKDLPLQGFYRRLLQLKRTHPALANAAVGVDSGTLEWLPTANDRALALRRVRAGRSVALTLNLDPKPQTINGHNLPGWGWHLEST